MPLYSKTGEVKYTTRRPIVYPAGKWDKDTTYIANSFSCPQVEHEGQYYVLNRLGECIGVNPKESSASNDGIWILMDKMQYLFTEVLMAEFAKLASAIYWGDYTFSQYGKDASGGSTTDYSKFDPTKIGQSDCPFTPNLMIDWLLGKLIGLDMDIRGGKVGSLRIDGNTLSTEDTKTGILIKAGSGKDYTGKRLELGGDGSAVVNIEMRPVTDEHGQLKLANGIVITNYGSGNKCIHILANGDGSIAIESYGGCRMVQRRGEIWDVPGVLWSARMSTTGKSAYWGDGCKITNVEKIATGKYRFYHDLGHDEYSVQATAIWVNWEVATVLDHTDTYFTIGLFHKDQGFLDGMYYVTVIGRNKVRT